MTAEARVQAAVAELAAALLEALAHIPAEADVPDRLYSVAEAGRLLGIGHSLTYDLIGRGELHSIRVGRRRLIPSSAVAAFLTHPPGAES